jgi:hypothetical protein
VARALSDTFALGVERAYLCAPQERRRFYQLQGWSPIIENVGTRGVTVFCMDRPA